MAQTDKDEKLSRISNDRKNKQKNEKALKSGKASPKRKGSIKSVSSRNTAIDDHLLWYFKNLTEALNENNELLRISLNTPSKQEGYTVGAMQKIMKEKIIKRPICVRVAVKCNFLRLVSIDTINQQFEAEMFILSKWQDPVFVDCEGSSADLFDEERHWRPHLLIKNCDGDLCKETVTFSVHPDLPGYDFPVVMMGWKFQAVLKESLELEDYPVDVQDLSIQLTSELSIDELNLEEDHKDLSTVNVNSFTDAQEWRIYHHVQFVNEHTVLETEKVTRYPLLRIQCRVARNLRYFLWNVIFIMFVITSLTFSCYAISADSSDRLAVNITLLLTAVTFKLVVTQSLPRISYLTSLDIYVLAALVFLGLHAVQNAILIYISTQVGNSHVKRIDFILILVLMAAMLLFHIIFGLKIYILSSKKRRSMKAKDRAYLLRLKQLGKVRSSAIQRAFKDTDSERTTLTTTRRVSDAQ